MVHTERGRASVRAFRMPRWSEPPAGNPGIAAIRVVPGTGS